MAQNLTTNIVINATVGNGFSQIGNTLTVLGQQVDQISDKLIGFGKESLKTYEDYEKNISTLETIWGSNGTFAAGSRELSNAISEIDATARDWAANTVFHTDDVSNALVEAAHAGWDMEDMLASMPAVMDMALAGNTDLSTALDMVLKSMKALGIDANDPAAVLDWTDEWIYAANRSAATAEDFGDTFLRMGSTMRLAADPEEILALTAVMADMGTTGSAAGTMVRNSILRLLAPSQTGKAFLEQLGATDEELRAIREDSTKIAAFDELQAHGFSVFDEAGQAKPVLEVYAELREALADIAGGYDNIISNETTLGILANVFGARSATGALNVVQGLEKAQQLYDDLISGAAEGVGEYTANIMSDTLWGRMMNWESKVENLKVRTGEALAEDVRPVLEVLGGIVDNITNLDTGTFNAIVAGLETIAAAGPALLLAGGAFRFIGYALTPAGGIGLGLIALTAAANAIRELEKADFADNFGNLELDSSQIQNYVQQLSEDFNSAYEKVNLFTGALEAAVTQYQTTSSTFKSNIITDMLTGVEIKEGSDEYNKLVGMGEDMAAAVRTGIDNNYAALMESITQTFGGDAEEIDSPIWAQILAVLEQGYQTDIDRATELSQQLRNAMTSAFADGHLTGEEVANIQSIIDEQNALLAQQQDREHYLERQRILRKAQTLGIDTIREASAQVEAERNAEWESLMDRQEGNYYDVSAWYDEAIKNGWMVPNTDGTEGEHEATETDKIAALAELRESQANERNNWTAGFNNYLLDLWTEGVTSSDLSGAWAAMETLAHSALVNNGYIDNNALFAYDAAVNPKDAGDAAQYLNEMVQRLGGRDVVEGLAGYLDRQGEADRAQEYRQLLTMYDIFNNRGFASPQVGSIYGEMPGSYYEGEAAKITGDIERMRGQIQDINENGYWVRDHNLQYRLSEQQEQFQVELIQENISAKQAELADLYAGNGIPVPVMPYIEGTDAVESLRDQGVQVQVEGDTEQLQATIEGEDGNTLMEYVSGDATDLHMTIWDEDGQTLEENVTGDPSELESIIQRYNGRTITLNLSGRQLFAEGGRATEASIFGEAGPEWAIPEEHSERTAALLDAARAASGFTWSELLANRGGLNANPSNPPVTLVYSPTIYAQDATGVEEKLAEDKARLEKWFAEKQMLDRLEVYS